jgi:glucosamine--fructose-6-phosphate aminotransferase (isomerizing)
MTTSGRIEAPSGLTRAEVESQPEVWGRVLAESAALTAPLPVAGEPVLFVGCGTSYYVGEAYARRRNTAGLGRTRAAIASEIPYVDPGEIVVLLSRSGTTTDLVRAGARLREDHRVVGIVGEARTPVVDVCDEVVLLDFADEVSVVQTRFATSAVLLLRASLREDLAALPGAAREALTLPVPEPLPDHTVFLGTDWTIGLAHEAALKCREAAGAWTEAYPIMEYQHGPIAVAGPRSLVWSLSPLPDFVRESVQETGARVLEFELDPLAQLVLVHRLALALAAAAGRDPDRPEHLSRSVQLD